MPEGEGGGGGGDAGEMAKILSGDVAPSENPFQNPAVIACDWVGFIAVKSLGPERKLSRDHSHPSHACFLRGGGPAHSRKDAAGHPASLGEVGLHSLREHDVVSFARREPSSFVCAPVLMCKLPRSSLVPPDSSFSGWSPSGGPRRTTTTSWGEPASLVLQARPNLSLLLLFQPCAISLRGTISRLLHRPLDTYRAHPSAQIPRRKDAFSLREPLRRSGLREIFSPSPVCSSFFQGPE